MAEIKYFTQEGLQRIKDELDELINKERPRIAQMIAEARDKGDLSENAEYDAAKEAQGLLELKISQLQDLLVSARVLDESKMDITKVLLLSKVKIRNLKNNATMSYTLVPEKEADLKNGKISVNSPIAKGLLGKSVGEKAEIEVPAGIITFEILEVSR
ncbi:MAG: transcription elongation factor GreA [Bacteroidales bacterium]|jgi:transcription elongation factor GreA|nr:transcription elongation factor GreA [Bacteroidales bacterium]MCK9448002.1 transcription elongation factor GreA [Bacteroidales bacterium]MDD3701063.1 transcription elongation factor GreA [Bacteroidales bacterium]MDY0369299.1 transcription elongation factor GreA [Bacteroidales bacterium]